ncbi:MAG: hypothetical protein M1825_002734 [Sarcosagium campestre]|nr:MAG: hypothetical protein M1825_002734 [Sarcosagium campestre]
MPMPERNPDAVAPSSSVVGPNHSAESPIPPVPASPQLPPFPSPKPIPISRVVSEFDLTQAHPYAIRSLQHHHQLHQLHQPHQPHHHSHLADAPIDETDSGQSTPADASVPPSLLSPAFTPPSTPGTSTPAFHREARCVQVDSSARSRKPKLLESLPTVNCIVGATIPTTTGTEMFLHLYQNSVDDKEHLAIVFGPHIRSRSLNAPQPGETEMDRMIRGAYSGRLYPGRTSSHLESGVPLSTPTASSPSPPGLSSSPHGSASSPATSSTATPPLVRIHSECYTGETAWSARCDCGEQLDEAARLMSLPSSTGGVIIYLRQEGRGIGLGEKLKAYNLQDLGSDTVEANLLLRHPADARSYGLATAILADLGLGGEPGIRLLTNNPDKIRAVEGPNREVIVRERVAMVPLAWRTGGKRGVQGEELGAYLKTKINVVQQDTDLGSISIQIEKMGHLL